MLCSEAAQPDSEAPWPLHFAADWLASIDTMARPALTVWADPSCNELSPLIAAHPQLQRTTWQISIGLSYERSAALLCEKSDLSR